jgi:TolB-like protein
MLVLAGVTVLLLANRYKMQDTTAAHTVGLRVAVLPFTNASPEAVPYLAEALTGEVIDALGESRELIPFRVPSDQAAQSLRNFEQFLWAADVPLLIDGTIRWTDGKLGIQNRLIDTKAEKVLLSTNYECAVNQVLGIPNDFALQVAHCSLTNLSAAAEARIRKTPTLNPEAYDYYLRGKVAQGTLYTPGMSNNASVLERAVQLDTNFALAYAVLSRTYVDEYFYTEPERIRELEPKASNAFTRALELDPNLAEAHFAKAYYYWTPSQRWQVETAITEGRRALELKPILQEPRSLLTLIFFHIGLFEQGRDLVSQSAKINPVNPITQFLGANADFWGGDNSKAADTWQAIRGPLSTNFVMNSYLAVALIDLDRTDEAITVISNASLTADIGGQFASVRAILAAKQGDKRGAQTNIANALEHSLKFGHSHHAFYNIACAYSLLNEQDLALEYLRQSAENGFPCSPMFNVDINLRNLSQNEKFKAFLAEQNATNEHYKKLFGKSAATAPAPVAGH